MLFTGANPGFYVRGTKFGKGSGDRLRSQRVQGRALVGWGGGCKGFEHLNSVSVNDFETFCGVFKCIKTCIFYK